MDSGVSPVIGGRFGMFVSTALGSVHSPFVKICALTFVMCLKGISRRKWRRDDYLVK